MREAQRRGRGAGRLYRRTKPRGQAESVIEQRLESVAYSGQRCATPVKSVASVVLSTPEYQVKALENAAGPVSVCCSELTFVRTGSSL